MSMYDITFNLPDRDYSMMEYPTVLQTSDCTYHISSGPRQQHGNGAGHGPHGYMKMSIGTRMPQGDYFGDTTLYANWGIVSQERNGSEVYPPGLLLNTFGQSS